MQTGMNSMITGIAGLGITVGNMGNILALWAVGFSLAAILVGMFTENTWKNTGITWALVLIGAVLLGIALTL